MNICLFKEEEIGKTLPANDERAKHIAKVLHKKEGDSFDAGIIGGKAGTATIRKIDENGIVFEFKEFEDEERANGKPLHPLTLIIGFPRPIQLRRLFRDVAGLGVKRIILAGTELTEKSYMESNDIKDGAAERMLLDGTVQAASTHVPLLETAKTMQEAIRMIFETEGCPKKCALDNRRAKMSLHKWLSSQTENAGELEKQGVVAAIGSERGWTDKERDLLESSGFTLCSMGNRVLRTETATTVASSIILDGMGVLN